MRWASAVAVVVVATLPLCAAPKKAKPAALHAKSVRASAKSPHLVLASSRTLHGRHAKTSRARYVPPAPTYQLHPDPDRYQEIQKALADRGYFKGEVNGEWGDDSTDALQRFQTDQKLPNDGKISALSLIGLGLGPKRDPTTATALAPAAAPSATPN